MEFCRPHMHENHLKPHLQCGTDPRMIRPHTRPFRTHRTAEGNHRRSRTDFSWRNIGFRASALSQKRQFVRDFLQHTISALFFINSGLQFQSNLKIAGSQIPLFPFFLLIQNLLTHNMSSQELLANNLSIPLRHFSLFSVRRGTAHTFSHCVAGVKPLY